MKCFFTDSLNLITIFPTIPSLTDLSILTSFFWFYLFCSWGGTGTSLPDNPAWYQWWACLHNALQVRLWARRIVWGWDEGIDLQGGPGIQSGVSAVMFFILFYFHPLLLAPELAYALCILWNSTFHCKYFHLGTCWGNTVIVWFCGRGHLGIIWKIQGCDWLLYGCMMGACFSRPIDLIKYLTRPFHICIGTCVSDLLLPSKTWG